MYAHTMKWKGRPAVQCGKRLHVHSAHRRLELNVDKAIGHVEINGFYALIFFFKFCAFILSNCPFSATATIYRCTLVFISIHQYMHCLMRI